MRFFFAWVDASETTFGPEHHRQDEQVFSFNVSQTEGDFAALELVIRNPREGLLAPGRETWAWLSVDLNGEGGINSETESESETEVVPLFFGRLVAMPDDIQNDAITLQFVARPADYEEQRAALAATLRDLPYFDPVFVAPDDREDPDKVLEARTALWHIDRITGEVTISDVINGEGGMVTLTADDAFYDGLSISIGQTPAAKVIVDATLGWTQKSSRDFDMVPTLTSRFGIDGFRIGSFNGPGFEDAWPEAGRDFGGGWSVTHSALTRADGFIYPAMTVQDPNDPDAPEVSISGLKVPLVRPGFTIDDWRTQATNPDTVIGPFVVIVPWTWRPILRLGYEASRTRSETVHFEISGDVQSLLSDPGEEEVLRLSMSSQEIDQAVDANGASPIQDAARPSYLTTDRGHQSLEYLIAVARAKLLMRARAVEASAEMSFHRAIHLSCRQNMTLEDPRLPGGTISGKIIGYEFGCDGDSGKLTGKATIGCTVGRGNTVSGDPGEPSYVDEGYVESGYQFYEGAIILAIDSSMTYAEFSDTPPVDDGLRFPLSLEKALLHYTVQNPPGAQAAAVAGQVFVDEGAVSEFLSARATTVSIEMKPVTGGAFVTPYEITVSGLMVPKTIDLEGVAP